KKPQPSSDREAERERRCPWQTTQNALEEDRGTAFPAQAPAPKPPSSGTRIDTHRTSRKMAGSAGIAQLVEHDLAKVGVASSSLVSRSNSADHRPGGRVVMQRTANPRTPVQFRPRPPCNPGKPRLARGFFVVVSCTSAYMYV